MSAAIVKALYARRQKTGILTSDSQVRAAYGSANVLKII